MQHLSQGFIKAQQERLIALYSALEGASRGQINIDTHADEVDAASATVDIEFFLSLMHTNRTILLDICAALSKIKDGTYGICEVSGNPINQERLEAIPFARFTVECQSQLERERRTIPQRYTANITEILGSLEEREADDEDEA